MKVTTYETLYHEDHGAILKHKCGKRIVALSQVRNEKKGEKGHKKKRRPKKMREKERRDNFSILLPHLCFKVAP